MLVADKITERVKCKIQHGKLNNRIYLMDVVDESVPQIIPDLNLLAKEKGYEKIFAKIPSHLQHHFLRAEYRIEATIPEFFNGNKHVSFMSKYFSEERVRCKNHDEITKLHMACQAYKKRKFNVSAHMEETESHTKLIENEFVFQIGRKEDAWDIAELYMQTFKTYPFPIFDPGFIKSAIEDDTIFFTLWKNQQLVAVASTEMDRNHSNVEMTDFATLETFRGKGLAKYLLIQMEREMTRQGIKTAFTIARALSKGMNYTFAGCGYTYAGTLINNTNIGESIESMNVWYKYLN